MPWKLAGADDGSNDEPQKITGVLTARTNTIRGVFRDNTGGRYVDDSPVPPSLDPRLLDMDGIETLRGPQGTLMPMAAW